MATAAVNQAGLAVRNLQQGSNALVAANNGTRVSQNIATSNTKLNAAAAGFNGLANKMAAIGNKSAAKNFQVAAINAATGKVVEAAAAANAGINKLKAAIKNSTLV